MFLPTEPDWAHVKAQETFCSLESDIVHHTGIFQLTKAGLRHRHPPELNHWAFLLLLKPHAKILSSHTVEPGREAPDVIIDIRHQKQNKTVMSASFVLKEWGTRPQLFVCQLSPLTMAALYFKLAFKVEQVYIVITSKRVASIACN